MGGGVNELGQALREILPVAVLGGIAVAFVVGTILMLVEIACRDETPPSNLVPPDLGDQDERP